jgi:hypothetical protein
MVILLPRHKTASENIGSSFRGGMEKGIDRAYEEMAENSRLQKQMQQQQKMQDEELGFFEREYGKDLRGSTPKQREIILSEALKGNKREEESEGKISGLQSALDTVNRMRGIGKKNNLGFGLGFRKLYSPEARQQSGEYEQLGKSLIQYASNIPIRNQQEFNTLAEGLYDPSKTDAEREGILSAMERIIKSSLSQYGSAGGQKKETDMNQQRPPLSAFRK